MPVLVLDGPEKAGKSTLAHEVIARWQGRTEYRHWGPVRSITEYLSAIIIDTGTLSGDPGRLIVWDRSWLSECVYPRLLNRPTDAPSPWHLEWLLGRAVMSMGMRVLVTPLSHMELVKRRDDSDHAVPAMDELSDFLRYAQELGWDHVVNDYTEDRVRANAEHLVERLVLLDGVTNPPPPVYCGPKSPPLLMVGERRNEQSRSLGAWLPFTTPFTTRAGLSMGGSAFRVGWTNAHDCPPRWARSFKWFVAHGEVAHKWLTLDVGVPDKCVLPVPHPASLYRFGSMRDRIGPVESSVCAFVNAVTGGIKQ